MRQRERLPNKLVWGKRPFAVPRNSLMLWKRFRKFPHKRRSGYCVVKFGMR
jgi:hypothetical protein